MWKSVIAWAAALGVGSALAAPYEPCGPVKMPGQVGPYDYRTNKDKLEIVESYHFTPEVETLRRGITGPLGGDIAYTLIVFPNHHRALISMSNLTAKERTDRPNGSKFNMKCWFERALRLAPDDGMVFMILGGYLSRHGDTANGVKAFEKAASLSPNDANVNYNLGLSYLQIKEYDKALDHAHKAYDLGFPLPGLRDRLRAAGKWRDPQPGEQSAADASRAEGAAK